MARRDRDETKISCLINLKEIFFFPDSMSLPKCADSKTRRKIGKCGLLSLNERMLAIRIEKLLYVRKVPCVDGRDDAVSSWDIC